MRDRLYKKEPMHIGHALLLNVSLTQPQVCAYGIIKNRTAVRLLSLLFDIFAYQGLYRLQLLDILITQR